MRTPYDVRRSETQRIRVCVARKNRSSSYAFLSLTRQSNPIRLQPVLRPHHSYTFSTRRSIHLQLVLLGTAGDLRELGLGDAGHESLQATEGLSHL